MRDVRADVTLSPRTSPFDLFPRETPPIETNSERRVLTIGISMWIVAALSLVAGIVVGFSSGYTAGHRAAAITSTLDAGAEREVPADAGRRDERHEPPAAFTEGTVAEPVRVDPQPIVAAPEVQSSPPPAVAPPAPPAPETRPPVDSAAGPPLETGAPVDAAVAPPRQTGAPVDAAPAPPRETRAPVDVTPTGPGSLHVLSRPSGATVIVDGQLIGRTPLILSEVDAGAHDVRLELEGFRGWSTSIEVRAGARARVAASLEQ